MDVSLKKILIVVSLGVAVTYILYSKTASLAESSTISDKDSAPENSSSHEYAVLIQLEEKQGDSGNTMLLDLEGVLQQEAFDDEAIVSSWSSLSRAKMLGKDLLQDFRILEQKPIRSVYSSGEVYLEHLIPDEIPLQIQKIQLGFLHKVILPKGWKQTQARSAEREEKDDLGTYTARYAAESGKILEVSKTWLAYKGRGIKLDQQENGFRYIYSPEGKLLSVEGILTVHYDTSPPISYRTLISMKLKEQTLAYSTIPSVQKNLKKVKIDSMPQEEAAVSNPADYEKIVERIDQIEGSSSSGEVYKIFSLLKEALQDEPSRASEISEKILSTGSSGESARRRLSLMFGALAQSRSAETINELLRLADACPDSYCRVQAIVGISDHPRPSLDAAERMLALAEKSRDQEVSGTALLSAGALAQKLGEKVSKVSPFMLSELAKPERSEQKTTILAAMGNHGAPEYLSALEAETMSARSQIRAAAVYSLRSLPQVEINELLLGVLEKEKDKDVLREAYKAIDYRDMSSREYQKLVQNSLRYPDADLQQMAARTLIHVHQNNPAKVVDAIDQLRSMTSLPEVRSYLAAELDAQ